MDWIFTDGDEVDITKLRTDFDLTYDDLERSVFNSLVERGLFTKDSKTQRGILITLAVISLVTLNILLSGLLFYLAKVLNGRTAEGDLADWKIDGLKLFLKNMSREYKWQAEQLIIVERMVPYAIAFGYIDKFMEQLKLSYPNYQPNWYNGNGSFFVVQPMLFFLQSKLWSNCRIGLEWVLRRRICQRRWWGWKLVGWIVILT